jgi:hypothetical protein
MMAMSGIHVCFASWWAICGLAGTGCTGCDSLLGKESNPDYCASPPCSPDGGGCRSNADCTSSGANVCDVMGTKQCVQCTATDHSACTAMEPVCGTDNTCRACAAHSECASDACPFADGSCAFEADVAYVISTGTDNLTCDKSAPCATVAAALMTKRPYVKIHGTINGEVMVDKGRMVTFLADPGATLTRIGGNILTIKDLGTSVAIYDLAISGAQGAAVGISVDAGAMLSLMRTTVSNNAGGGISSAGALVIDHSVITSNGSGGPGIFVTGDSLSLAQSLVSGNRGGGVQVAAAAAKFAIVSNKFVSNGAGDPMGSLFGAVYIAANFASTNLLEFNTFYKNLSSDGFGAAIRCDPATFAARANIMFGNGTATSLDQTSGTCTHIYSITNPGKVPTGASNQASDPLFVDPAGGNFHLQAGSPAVGAADALAPLTGLSARDFDDHPRMTPVNLGAYQ